MTTEKARDIVREEAQEIKALCDQAKSMSNRDRELLEAYEVIDKALQTEPCEDCVSRQAVDKLKSDIMSWINSSNRGNADYFIVDKIEELVKGFNPPSVYPKAKMEVE